MEDNRVKVRIYGQDYIISGERDEETIREIAAFVDSSIREVSKYFSGNAQGSLAVLAAVNITDELFETREKIAALTAAREQAGEDAQHYLKMWDEAKKSFMQYKEEAAAAAAEKHRCEEKYRQLEEKCSEFESSFFDIQMENIRLKSELEKSRKNDE